MYCRGNFYPQKKETNCSVKKELGVIHRKIHCVLGYILSKSKIKIDFAFYSKYNAVHPNVPIFITKLNGFLHYIIYRKIKFVFDLYRKRKCVFKIWYFIPNAILNCNMIIFVKECVHVFKYTRNLRKNFSPINDFFSRFCKKILNNSVKKSNITITVYKILVISWIFRLKSMKYRSKILNIFVKTTDVAATYERWIIFLFLRRKKKWHKKNSKSTDFFGLGIVGDLFF